VHVSHQEADWLDLDGCALLLVGLWDGILDFVFLLNSLEDFKLSLASHFHVSELVTMGKNAWNVLVNHVLID
jgi:hypothetical protein